MPDSLPEVNRLYRKTAFRETADLGPEPQTVLAAGTEVAEQIAVLTTALRWYAHPDNWRKDDWNVEGVINPPDYGNPGRKARTALKRAEKIARGEA